MACVPFATLCDDPTYECEVPVPSVRPPPLTGAIPNDSFLRRSISDCTNFPMPKDVAGDFAAFLVRGLSYGIIKFG